MNKMINTINTNKNTDLYKWRPVTFVKQIETANICLNVERDCISVILDPRQKLDPPGVKSSIRPCIILESQPLTCGMLNITDVVL